MYFFYYTLNISDSIFPAWMIFSFSGSPLLIYDWFFPSREKVVCLLSRPFCITRSHENWLSVIHTSKGVVFYLLSDSLIKYSGRPSSFSCIIDRVFYFPYYFVRIYPYISMDAYLQFENYLICLKNQLLQPTFIIDTVIKHHIV